MLRKTFLRYHRRQYRFFFYRELIKFYKKYLLILNVHNFESVFQLGLGIYQPKRQLITDIYSIKKITISTGVILKTSSITLKCYKRKIIASSAVILFLQKRFKLVVKYLYFLFFKNFTLRLWLFLQKLWVLVEPSIFMFLHGQSTNPTVKGVRRIKRRVLRMLKKQ